MAAIKHSLALSLCLIQSLIPVLNSNLPQEYLPRVDIPLSEELQVTQVAASPAVGQSLELAKPLLLWAAVVTVVSEATWEKSELVNLKILTVSSKTRLV